jgi:hypothetical protein
MDVECGSLLVLSIAEGFIPSRADRRFRPCRKGLPLCFQRLPKRWTSGMKLTLNPHLSKANPERYATRSHFSVLRACHQTGITLSISSVRPLERFVGLVPESINLGDLARTVCVVFRNQLPQCGVRLFFPTNRVLMRAAYSALASL